jgi:Uma2 family endonuclease
MSMTDLLWRAAQGPLTIDDLRSEIDNIRIELIDGSLYVSPLGDAEHQRLIIDYALLIRGDVPARLQVYAGINVILGEQTLVIPDFAVADPDFLVQDGLGVSPEGLRLAVEITSPSTRRRDLTIKRELYCEWHVPLVIVDRSTRPFTMLVEGQLPDYGRALLDHVG